MNLRVSLHQSARANINLSENSCLLIKGASGARVQGVGWFFKEQRLDQTLVIREYESAGGAKLLVQADLDQTGLSGFPQPDPARSGLMAVPSDNVPADNVSASNITVTAIDVFDSPIPFAEVILTVTGPAGGPVGIFAVQANETGTLFLPLTSPVAGQFDVTAEISFADENTIQLGPIPVTFVEPQAQPDLTTSIDYLGPDCPLVGRSIAPGDLLIQVSNGPAATGDTTEPTVVAVVAGSSPALTIQDRVVGTFVIANIPQGASIDLSYTGADVFQVSPFCEPTATAYIGVVADPNNDQAEVDESNNSASDGPIEVKPVTGVELFHGNVIASDNNLVFTPGATSMIEVVLKNGGDMDADDVDIAVIAVNPNVDFQLQPRGDPILDLLAEVLCTSVPAGGTVTEQIPITFNPSVPIPPGVGFQIACVLDLNGAFNQKFIEDNELNNEASVIGQVDPNAPLPALPDLVASSCTVSSRDASGVLREGELLQNSQLSYVFGNSASATVATNTNVFVGLTSGTGPVVTAADRLINFNVFGPGLQPGAFFDQSFNFFGGLQNIAPALSAGSQRVSLFVDPFGQVLELIEGNNIANDSKGPIDFQAVNGVDLCFADFLQGPPRLINGVFADFQASVANVGDSDATGFSARVTIVNPNIDDQGNALGDSFVEVIGIASGFNIPANSIGVVTVNTLFGPSVPIPVGTLVTLSLELDRDVSGASLLNQANTENDSISVQVPVTQLP